MKERKGEGVKRVGREGEEKNKLEDCEKKEGYEFRKHGKNRRKKKE